MGRLVLNFHLTANKVFDWFVVVLIDDINIVLRKQNLYLLKKNLWISLIYLSLPCLKLPVGQNWSELS